MLTQEPNTSSLKSHKSSSQEPPYSPSACRNHVCYEDLTCSIVPKNFTNLVKDKISIYFPKSKEKDLLAAPYDYKRLQFNFYENLTRTLALQKAIGLIISDIKDNYQSINFENLTLQKFSNMLDETLKNLDLVSLCQKRLYEQEKDFTEMQKMVTTYFNNNELKESLIKGGQDILDLAAGRGEFGTMLLLEIYLERLQRAKLPTNARSEEISAKFNELGFKPNKLTFVEPQDYSNDVIEILRNLPNELKDVYLTSNIIETKNALLQEVTYPKDSIIIAHRACGTLSDDIIESFNQSHAKSLLVMPCCFYKALVETPRYGISKEKWGELCLDTNTYFITNPPHNFDSFSAYLEKYNNAWKFINNKRLEAFKSDIEASCFHEYGLPIIFAARKV